MFKTKGAMFGIAAALVVAGLTFASMAVTTTSGAGTDDTDSTPEPTAVAQPTTAPPPQAPIEAPADTTVDPTGGSQGAGTGPGGLPNAGYGTSAEGGANTMLLGLAGIVLMAGSGLMFAASKAGGRKS